MKARPIFIAGLVLAGIIAAGSARADLDDIRATEEWDFDTTRAMCAATGYFSAIRAEDAFGFDSPQVDLAYTTADYWAVDLPEKTLEMTLRGIHASKMPWPRVLEIAKACTEKRVETVFYRYQ